MVLRHWATEDPQELADRLAALQISLGGRPLTIDTAFFAIEELQTKDTDHETLIAENASEIAQLKQTADLLMDVIGTIETRLDTTATRITLTGQSDMNSSLTGVEIQLGEIDPEINTIEGLSLDGNAVVLNQGIYRFSLSASVQSISSRTNIRFDCLNPDMVTAVATQYMPCYIRNASGHNEAGAVFSRLFYVPSDGSKYTFRSSRLSNVSGTVNLIGSPYSSLDIQRIK